MCGFWIIKYFENAQILCSVVIVLCFSAPSGKTKRARVYQVDDVTHKVEWKAVEAGRSIMEFFIWFVNHHWYSVYHCGTSTSSRYCHVPITAIYSGTNHRRPDSQLLLEKSCAAMETNLIPLAPVSRATFEPACDLLSAPSEWGATKKLRLLQVAILEGIQRLRILLEF